MKKLRSAALSILTLALLAAPAYADAALPPYHNYYEEATKWIAAFAVALVIIAVAVIVAVIRHRRRK